MLISCAENSINEEKKSPHTAFFDKKNLRLCCCKGTATLSITTFSLKASFATFSITAFTTTTLSITTLCYYAECLVLFIVMLNVVVPSLAILSAVMLNVVMLSVVVLLQFCTEGKENILLSQKRGLLVFPEFTMMVCEP